MQNKYQVKIEDSILPQLYTFDQLINEGLLDDVDEKIKVRLDGSPNWTTARDYPFSKSESEHFYHSIREGPSPIDIAPPHSTTSQLQEEYPSIVNHWNWGAFCLPWVWGIFNGLYWPLLIIIFNFIPYIGLLLAFCCCALLGKNGNLYAWEIAKRRGCSIEQFALVQSKWNTAGAVVLVLALLFVLGFITFL